MGSIVAYSSNWFVDNLSRKMGLGLFTSFCKDLWIGNTPFFVMFPRLFSIPDQQNWSVRPVGILVNSNLT